jgi:hypothetical protein
MLHLMNLIDADRRVWNKTLIGQIFRPLDALDIVNISLSSKDTDDILFWPGEKNDKYSVRSAHHFLCHKKNSEPTWSFILAL